MSSNIVPSVNLYHVLPVVLFGTIDFDVFLDKFLA